MLTLRCRVLTPDPTADRPYAVRWLTDAVVVIDGRHFVEVAPFDGRPVDEDLRPGVLLPGFVDGHIHFPQTRIVGSASGPLLPWLQRSTFPEEARFADRAHAEHVAAAFTASLAAAGTTLSMVYSSRHRTAADAVLHALDRRGLRAIVGPVWMDERAPDALQIAPEQSAEDLCALAERWHGHDDGRLEVGVIPRFAITSSKRGMRLAGDLARERGLWVTTHLAENTDECEAVESLHGGRYLDVYVDAGLVHARSVFAHCIHLSQAEWDRFAEAGAIVAHCPDSNAFLGSGHMPIDDVERRNIPMVIGTDVAAGRSFRVPRILSSAYDNALARGVQVSPSQLLWWGTRSGAVALQQPQTGAVAPGLEADAVLVDVPDWVEAADEVLAWSLFWADAPWPRRTWVRGQVVWDRQAWTEAGGVFPWDAPRH